MLQAGPAIKCIPVNFLDGIGNPDAAQIGAFPGVCDFSYAVGNKKLGKAGTP